MSAPNPNKQSLLINKLILLALVSILGCLIVLIVRQKNFMDEREQAARSRSLVEATEPSAEQALIFRSPAYNERLSKPASFQPTPASSSYPALPPGEVTALPEGSSEETRPVPPPVVQPVVALSAPILQSGGIAGTAWLRGTPPPEIPIQMNTD